MSKILSHDEAAGWAFATVITCGMALPFFFVYLLVTIIIRIVSS